MELKEIAGYLPYGIRFKGRRRGWKSEDDSAMILCPIDLTGEFDEIKLILHPLTDLTKPCLEGGKIPIVELLKIQERKYISEHDIDSKYLEIGVDLEGYPQAYFEYNAIRRIMLRTNDLINQKYWIIQKLFEWHFDVFGLIEKGEGIDINTISK